MLFKLIYDELLVVILYVNLVQGHHSLKTKDEHDFFYFP